MIDAQQGHYVDHFFMRLCCGVCLFHPVYQELLLVKQKEAQKWSFPKGRQKNRERIFDCVKRELLEETGIHLDRVQHYVIRFIRLLKYRIMVAVCLSTSRPRLHIRDTREIEKGMWVSARTIPDLSLNYVTRSIWDALQKSRDFLPFINKGKMEFPLHPPTCSVGSHYLDLIKEECDVRIVSVPDVVVKDLKQSLLKVEKVCDEDHKSDSTEASEEEEVEAGSRWDYMSYKELQKECRTRKLKTGGKKKELLQRLKAFTEK